MDVHLMVGCRRLLHRTCPLHELHAATFACLEFTTQKNGVRGEMIGLGRSGNAAFCAMALLCGNVDTDRIRLLGRWRSDKMLRYLHVQAFPVVANIASTMLQHGNFTLIPNNPHPTPRGDQGPVVH